jgi:hypothetical protein
MIDYETDEINRNPSMRGFVAAVQKLSELPEHKTRSDMPEWMKTIHMGMSTASHINVALFLGRVCLNMNDVFAPFASFWWRSIVRIISKGEEYGSGIHQLMHDLCLVLLTWDTELIKPDTSPDSKDMRLMSGMFRYLANNSGGQNRVFNQKMLRLLVERFSSAFYPPTDILYSIISTSGNDQKADNRRSSGLMLTSILIVNGIDPFCERQCKFSRIEFGKRLVKMTDGQAKSARVASEVVGQYLNLLKTKNAELESELLAEVNSLLNKMEVTANPLQNVMDSFVRIINLVNLFYPPIVQIHAKELLYIFPKLKDKCKDII